MVHRILNNLAAVNPTTGDQTTAYLYGTTLTESGVARNDLLRYTLYPDAEEIWPNLSVDGWATMTVDDWANLEITSTDSVSYTYNALGQQTSITDQRGTVRSLNYDKVGRVTNDCVSTVGSDTDDTVLQIATSYEVRGMVQSVTSLDNATPGSGTALNQTWSTYNSFGQLTEEQQDHSGTVTTGSVSVGYGYDDGTGGANEIRLNQLIYPNGRLIDYSYASGMDSMLNRITAIVDDGSDTTLASYDYLGLGTVVRITYPEPSIWLDLWGGTSGTFAGLDQFNRIIDQRWQNGITTTPTDIDRYQYGYDQNSNRLWKANVVGTAAVGNFDEGYAYDTLNRLAQMQRGTLSGGVIVGTPAAEQDWILDPLGNWSTFATAASGTTNLSQQRIANTVNEITAITETTGPTWITPAYDAAGNTTTMPQIADPTQAFTAVHDAWNRMVSIGETSGTVGSYTYDGRNRRIIKVTSSETRHLYWTGTWQDVEERVGTATMMDRQYVWGVRYIDELVCRDDATPERLYACQDANFNITAITTGAGGMAERYAYYPYGPLSFYSPAWTPITASGFSWDVCYQGLAQDYESGAVQGRTRYLFSVMGRWAVRDSIGYSYFGAPNLYLYIECNPTTYNDPSGMIPSSQPCDPCPCIKNPNNCYFAYSPWAPKGGQGNIHTIYSKPPDPAAVQEYAVGYSATLRPKDNTSTALCHILQDAEEELIVVNPAKAKPIKVADLDLNAAHAKGFKSWATPPTVYVSNTTDYIAADTRTVTIGGVGYAQITDRPTVSRSIADPRYVSFCRFTGNDSVLEAPAVTGYCYTDATFIFVANHLGKIKYNIKSSDGNMNKSGTW